MDNLIILFLLMDLFRQAKKDWLPFTSTIPPAYPHFVMAIALACQKILKEDSPSLCEGLKNPKTRMSLLENNLGLISKSNV